MRVFFIVGIIFTSSSYCSLSAIGDVNLLHTLNDPTLTGFDEFGKSVDVDGRLVLIGAPRDNTGGSDVGQAHLFDAVTGRLIHTFDDPTVTESDLFGFSVAIHGELVLIGAPGDDTSGRGVGQAHLFDATTGNLLHTFDDPTVTDDDGFGLSVAVHGNRVLIGALRDDTNGENVGQAHLFDSNTGDLLHTYDDPTVTDGDVFGTSVSIDGNNVLIGALGDDTNGRGVGQAHLFDATTGNLLHTFDDPTVTTFDQFGRSVSVSGDHVLIGAGADRTNGDLIGQAHLFHVTTGDLLHTFDDPTITRRDQFGYSVAISGDNVLIGAREDDTNSFNAGQAYLFDAVSGNLMHIFDDPTVASNDNFGNSVAIDGHHVLIGAALDNTQSSDVGQAHLFDIPIPEPGTSCLIIGMGLLTTSCRKWPEV